MRLTTVSKIQRQKRILSLVRSRPVMSQQELNLLLTQDGVRATQATLSRDLRNLNLVKTPGGYRLPADLSDSRRDESRIRQTISQFMTDVAAANNLVVIRTSPGSAHPVALSLDDSGWKDIVGTVAGDDTVLVVARNAPAARNLKKKIQALTSL
jgi:transcriptional regulator of arginine metabolism